MTASITITLPVHAAPPPVRVPMTLMLDMADGSRISFHETEATDLGAFDDGPIHQRCLRQKSTDLKFLVDFRPEVDGSRDEVVIEYGTLFKFGTAGVAPQTAGGTDPINLGMPPAVFPTKTPGGTGTVANPIAMVATSYVLPSGEGIASGTGQWLAMAATDRMVVPSPPAMTGAIGYHVYVLSWDVTPNNVFVRQTTAPVPFGQAWTSPAGGFAMTGPAPMNESAWPVYKATISGGTLSAPVPILVYHHECRTRWRFQSAPRPVVRTAQDLVTSKAAPPLSAIYLGNTPAPPTFTYDGPMSLAGLFAGEHATGEREEVGLITEQQAHWMMTGNAGSLTTILAQAEAVGSMPLWVRDVDTGRLVDFSAHNYVCFNDVDRGPGKIPVPAASPIGSNFFDLTESHHPTAAAIPYVITRDPYFLENHHAQTNYGWLETNYYQKLEQLPLMSCRSEPRSLAWHWRDIARSILFTPAITPSWMRSQASWRTCVADNVEYGRRYLAATVSPCTTVFRFFPDPRTTQAFMEDYVLHAAGYIMWSRAIPELDALIRWMATPRIAMGFPPTTAGTKNKYGWDPRYPMFYYGPVSDARLKANASGSGADDYKIAASANTPTTWGELFDDLMVWAPAHDGEFAVASGPNSVSSMQSGYLPWVRSGLAILAQAGIPEAKEAHDWLAARVTGFKYKWSFAPPA